MSLLIPIVAKFPSPLTLTALSLSAPKPSPPPHHLHRPLQGAGTIVLELDAPHPSNSP